MSPGEEFIISDAIITQKQKKLTKQVNSIASWKKRNFIFIIQTLASKLFSTFFVLASRSIFAKTLSLMLFYFLNKNLCWNPFFESGKIFSCGFFFFSLWCASSKLCFSHMEFHNMIQFSIGDEIKKWGFYIFTPCCFLLWERKSGIFGKCVRRFESMIWCPIY